MLTPSEVGAVLPKRKCDSISDDDSGCALDEYSWITQGMSHLQVLEYMNSLSRTKSQLDSHASERLRVQQLLRQLPPQDSRAIYCVDLSSEEKSEFYLFQNSRKRDALGRGTVTPLSDSSQNRFCSQCHQKLIPRELVIFASRAGPCISWHPACFVCCVCKETLVDLIYFYKDGQIYCGRHHAEMLKPRCVTCDEIIFADECTEAEGFSWHTRHFSCFKCNQLLGGQKYIMQDGRPFCCPCYELLYAECCESCGQIISVQEGRMTHQGHQWHATDLCFSCRRCGKSLKYESFLLKKSELYCSTNCLNGVTAISYKPEKVICHSRKQIASLKSSVDDSRPEDSVSWTSIFNREDQSSASVYSEIYLKWKSGSQCSDDPSPQDSYSLTETDSGLNLTFTASTGHIPRNDQSKLTDINQSSSEVLNLPLKESRNTKTNQIQSSHACYNNYPSSELVANSSQDPAKKSPMICPTNYMINPEKYFLNSLTTDSNSLHLPLPSPPILSSCITSTNHMQSCGAISPVPHTLVRQTANRLSPVNEICSSELLVGCNSLYSSNALPMVSHQGCSPTKSQINCDNALQMQLCNSCSGANCNCPTKASLPDLSFATVFCEKKWKQNPYMLLKRHSSSNAQNPHASIAASVGGRRTSGYDSDSALKRRRIKQHHKQDTNRGSNNSTRRLPKLGTGETPKCIVSEFRPNLSSHPQLANHVKVTDWKEFKSNEIKRLAELNLECDACSTCSSSSGSEFDYYLDRSNVQFSNSTAAGSRQRKRKNKQCIIS